MATHPRAFPFVLSALTPLAVACGRVSAAPHPAAARTEPASHVAVRATGDALHFAKALAAPATVEIRSVNGTIAAAVSDDDVTVVDGERVVERGGDLSEVRMVAVEHPGGVVVCALFADEDDSDCAPDGDVSRDGRAWADALHAKGSHDGAVATRFTVRVPRGVSFVARTLNGTIAVDGLASDVRATTLNGAVRVRARGKLEVQTLNGRIDAVVEAAGAGPFVFETMNGDVAVTVPESFDADVDASTMRGDIDSDFALEEASGFGPSTARGRIGHGGPALRATTMNGDVTIRRVR